MTYFLMSIVYHGVVLALTNIFTRFNIQQYNIKIIVLHLSQSNSVIEMWLFDLHT